LYLPPFDENCEDSQAEEEARVVFVAATRARRELKLGKAATVAWARRLDPSGRAFTPYPFSKGQKRAAACVEIGRAGDIDAVGLVGRKYFNATAALNSQTLLLQLPSAITYATAAIGQPDVDFRYIVTCDAFADTALCYLTDNVNHDMFGIAEAVDKLAQLGKTNPPDKLPYLRLFGVRTVALSPDDPCRHLLHSPWRESGFLVAPILIGYGMVYFRYRKTRKWSHR
jgi:hypothetical protein